MSTRFVHNNTHVGFLLIVFSRIKDIQLLGINHYACVTQKVGPLHIIQNEISSKRSKKTKIYQRSFSTVFNDLSNQTKKQHRQFSSHMPFKVMNCSLIRANSFHLVGAWLLAMDSCETHAYMSYGTNIQRTLNEFIS